MQRASLKTDFATPSGLWKAADECPVTGSFSRLSTIVNDAVCDEGIVPHSAGDLQICVADIGSVLSKDGTYLKPPSRSKQNSFDGRSFRS